MANSSKTEARVNSHAITISADTVAENLADKLAAGDISGEDRDQILWFASHIREKGLSNTSAGRLIDYDGSTVGRVLGGTYEGSWPNVVAAIRDYHTKVAARAEMTSAKFIETSIWERIKQVCDFALYNQMPGTIMGLSQMGKTYALKEYQRRALVKTVRYVRIPAGGGIRATVEAIAKACGISTDGHISTARLRDRILGVLSFRSLLIVDEIHQLALSSEHAAKTSMEFIREIFDECECGLVICGTNAVEESLLNGPLRAWLDQFSQRCITTTVLPDRLSFEDLCLVAKEYGLPPPEGRAAKVAKGLRMNRLVKILMLGSGLAKNRGEAFTWEHFLAANEAVRFDATAQQ